MSMMSSNLLAAHESRSPIMPVGLLVVSPAALDTLARYGVRASELVAMHIRAEWPDMSRYERAENMRAVKEFGRVEGRYRLPGPPATDVVVISELLRVVTYILLPIEGQSLLDLVPVGERTIELRPPGCRPAPPAPPMARGAA
jgi:hypothetical protein